MEAVLGKVFMIYAIFWVVVIVGLFFGVGALVRKRERTLDRRHQQGH